MFNTRGTQTLTLTGLRFDASLGILEQEKIEPQPIQPANPAFRGTHRFRQRHRVDPERHDSQCGIRVERVRIPREVRRVAERVLVDEGDVHVPIAPSPAASVPAHIARNRAAKASVTMSG